MKWIFSKKARDRRVLQKASRVLQRQAVMTPGNSYPRATDYRSFAAEGYEENSIMYRCVKKKMEAVSSIPIHLFRDENGKKEPVDDHFLLDSLKNPSPLRTYQSFIEEVVGYYTIGGEVGIEVAREGKEIELYAIRPDQISIKKNDKGQPIKYIIYSHGDDGRGFEVNPITGASDLIFIKDFNPRDYYRGTSPFRPSSRAGDLHNEMNRWNLATMRNSGRPSGALTLDKDETKGLGGELTPNQRGQVKEWLEGFTGSENAGRIALLEHGLKWEQMSLNARELEFAKTKNITEIEICAGLGIPPQMLGIPGTQTFANYEQARLSFYQEVAMPLLRLILGYLNRGFVKNIDESLYLDFKEDEIGALAPVRRDLYASLQGATYLTTNEKRKLSGLGDYMESDKPGDKILTAAGQVPVEDVSTDIPGGIEEDFFAEDGGDE